MTLMARQVRPWLVKPESPDATVSAYFSIGAPTSRFHQGQWRNTTSKVRMYGCNLFLRPIIEMKAWQTRGVHVRGIRAFITLG